MIGCAGNSGTKEIIEHKKELKKLYPDWFFLNFNNYYKIYSSKERYDKIKFILKDFKINVIIESSDGGIMATLYQLYEKIHKGFTVDLLSIPIRQETVEISEHFSIDPYRLSSRGSFILALDNALCLKDKLNNNNIESEIIGYIENKKSKIILFDVDKEVRCLDKPRQDEEHKVID